MHLFMIANMNTFSHKPVQELRLEMLTKGFVVGWQGFYLYLYIGSIMFLVYAYVFLLQTINIPTSQLKSKFQSLRE